MNTELMNSLKEIALKRSKPFCYSCYKLAPTGRCETCGSDDLMRHLEGVGVEYGTDWIVKHLIETELTPIDTEEYFEEFVRSCYAETIQVGWLTLDTVSVIKDQDPISWQLACSEHIDQEVQDEVLFTLDEANYFRFSDVEEFVDEEGGE